MYGLGYSRCQTQKLCKGGRRYTDDVIEIVDLSNIDDDTNEGEVIDVESYILDVMLIKIKQDTSSVVASSIGSTIIKTGRKQDQIRDIVVEVK